MATRAIIERLRRNYDAHPVELVCAWLFGSRARGTSRPDSDVDVAVLRDRDPAQTLDGSAIAMAGDIEAAIGEPRTNAKLFEPRAYNGRAQPAGKPATQQPVTQPTVFAGLASGDRGCVFTHRVRHCGAATTAP